MSKKTIIFIFTLSFLFRILILSNSDITFFSDDAIYASLARHFSNGKFLQTLHPTWPPLYPALSAIVHIITNRWETALQLVSSVSAAMISIPLFIFSKKYLDKRSATVFTLLTSFSTPFIEESLMPLSDMLSSLLTISFITAMFCYFQKVNNKLIAICGCLVGLIYLTRSEGFMFFLLSLIFLTIFHLVSARRTFLNILIFVITFLLITSPYSLTMQKRFGYFSFSQKASAQIKQGRSFELRKNDTTWSQEVVSISNPNYSSEYFTGGIGHILEYGDWFWWWFLQKSTRWISLYWKLFPIWATIPLFFGIFKSITKKYFWSSSYILFVSTIAIIATVFGTPSTEVRYLLWLLPILTFFFVKGIYEIARISKFNRFSFAAIAVAIIALPTFSPNLILHPVAYASSFRQSHYRPEIISAGEFVVSDSLKSQPKIMSRHEALEFYSKGTTIYTPELSVPEIIKYAKRKEVDYLSVWSFELGNDKELAKLVNPEVNIPEIVPVFTAPEITIYKLTN